jgi:hypothetical protein
MSNNDIDTSNTKEYVNIQDNNASSGSRDNPASAKPHMTTNYTAPSLSATPPRF